jgi:peptide/nickel transport system substrate-binding protein
MKAVRPLLTAAALVAALVPPSGLAMASVTVPAASGPGLSAGSSATTSTLTISAADGETWPCGFNPFNPDTYFFSLGLVYEELYYVDSVASKMTPWLATSYKWSDNAKTLTWTIRKGVHFSNGQALSAADVAYTFNLIKKYPALDLNAIYPQLLSTTQTGPYTVVMKFRSPASLDFYYIADQTPIVPEHLWQGVKDPTTYTDPTPVGTGPYTVQACTPENISYQKNVGYWQPGRPKIDRVEVPAILTDSVSNEELANGTAQWGGEYIPDIQKFYLNRNHNYRTWSPPVGVNGMYINLTDPILKDVAVRQAMAYGINRAQIAKLAYDGEVAAASQTTALLPEEGAWYNSTAAAKYNDYRYSPAKAVSVLKAAGYKRGTGGIFETPSGRPLDFTLIDVGAYSDQVTMSHVIVQDMAKIGIKVTQENLSGSTRSDDSSSGKFQLIIQGPPQITMDGPAGILRGLLYSGNSAPIGKPAASDFERYSSKATDSLFIKLAATTNVAAQERIVKQIELVMLQDVPYIPLTDAAAWNEYDAGFATGWPTPSNPYANPSPTTQPDEEVVLLHLVPKG